MFSGRPGRFNSVPATAPFTSCSERFSGSITGPGRMQFTRTARFRWASSTANVRVSAGMAPLLAK